MPSDKVLVKLRRGQKELGQRHTSLNEILSVFISYIHDISCFYYIIKSLRPQTFKSPVSNKELSEHFVNLRFD